VWLLQASKKEESFSTQLRTLTAKCKEAEARAEFAERSVTKLQKEVDRLEGKKCLVKASKHLIRPRFMCQLTVIFSHTL